MTKNELRTVSVPFFLFLFSYGLAMLLTQLILIQSHPLLAISTTVLNIYTLYRLMKRVIKLTLGEDDNA